MTTVKRNILANVAGHGWNALMSLLFIPVYIHFMGIEAYGLGWIAIGLAPVANLLFPVGVLVAERTLYLPSAGAMLAAGTALAGAAPAASSAHARAPAAWAVLLGILVAGGALRSATRVPVWRDDVAVVESMLRDSPRSYRGYAARGGLLLRVRRPGEALALKWDDVDTEGRTIRVSRAVSEGEVKGTKSGAIRDVDLTFRLAAALEAWTALNDR